MGNTFNEVNLWFSTLSGIGMAGRFFFADETPIRSPVVVRWY